MEMMFGKDTSQAGVPAGGHLVVDGSTQTFVTDVIEASAQVPVIVDFWATWCGPCKTLGPSLERLVREAKGKVRLVKIDIDKNQQLAAQLRIQSVPTVYAFQGGRPVDGFTGALPESQLRDFIKRLTGGVDPLAAIDDALSEAARFLDEGDAVTASEIYSEILANDPVNGTAYAGLIRALVASGSEKEAKRLIDEAPPEIARHADVLAQKTALDLAAEARDLAPTRQLEIRLEAEPGDHQARFDLAVALFAAGRREDAVEQLLELFRRDRAWNEDGARKQLLKFFEAMGQADPLTMSARRRLSSLMFS